MDIGKSSAKSTVIQVVLVLLIIAALVFINIATIEKLYLAGDISKVGLVINSIIFALFFIGMIRMVMVLFRYVIQHRILLQLTDLLKENALDPIARLPQKSIAVTRYKAVEWVAKQNAPINQEALAASANAHENSRLTLIRFVHSTLILAGVFGTVVSLSMALIGAAGLLTSPEGVKEMSSIIGSMSSALSSTITAIVCFFVFAYFYLRLNDARIQMLTHIEDMTSMYLIPKVTHSEDGMIREVTLLTEALNKAADKVLLLEENFMKVGDRLQIAVDDLHSKVNSNNIGEIKDLIRKGFHLSEPEYATKDKQAEQLESDFKQIVDIDEDFDVETGFDPHNDKQAAK
ncbi:MAG: hypothetical protein V7749_13435 [Cocleimonas sp.]